LLHFGLSEEKGYFGRDPRALKTFLVPWWWPIDFFQACMPGFGESGVEGRGT